MFADFHIPGSRHVGCDARRAHQKSRDNLCYNLFTMGIRAAVAVLATSFLLGTRHGSFRRLTLTRDDHIVLSQHRNNVNTLDGRCSNIVEGALDRRPPLHCCIVLCPPLNDAPNNDLGTCSSGIIWNHCPFHESQ